MIRYYPKEGVIVMDLVDLEHCGFNHDDFAGELFLAGIENSPLWPVALIVNFGGGAVITGRAQQQHDAAEYKKHFELLLARLGLSEEAA